MLFVLRDVLVKTAAERPTAIAVIAPREPVTPSERVALFDGQSLAGWTVVARGTTVEPDRVWRVEQGAVATTGRPVGYVRTLGRYRDYVLRAEWRWPGAAGNSGILVHVASPDKVWPACLEVQLRSGEAGSIRALGGAKVRELDPAAKDPTTVARRGGAAEKPAGEWNTCEITCRGDTVTVTINGVRQNEVTRASVTAGAIAFQAEGAPVEFRNLVIAPLAASPTNP